jgi:hypothetical protein
MNKYMLLYVGPATPPDQITPEQGAKIMEGWNNWISSVGSAMVDVGFPLANGVSVVDDGSKGKPSLVSGYSIIQADNVDEARKLVQGHPFLSDATGKFSVEVHELQPLPAGM